MKKFALIALVLVLTLCLCACGRNRNEDTSVSTSESTTAPTILPMPSTNATLDPMPETSMPQASDGTMSTDATSGENAPGSTNGASMPVG